jgi:U3 small nucleolar RNA-associated protein 10
MVVASMDVNGVTRAAAVQGMLRTLRESPGIDSETLVGILSRVSRELSPRPLLLQESLRSAFVARVHDTSIEVLKALYSEPSVLLPVLLSDTAAFIQAVSEAVTAKPSQTSRAILRVHISFLALHFLPAVSQDVVEDAFSRAIFPFLLFSKPKFRTAQAVWEIVDAAQKSAPESGLARCESLEGCVEIVRDEERQFQKAKARKDKSVPSAFDNPDVMRRINLAVASRMAGKYDLDAEDKIVC